MDIPQWQIDKVLAVKSKVAEDSSLLIDWETVKQNMLSINLFKNSF